VPDLDYAAWIQHESDAFAAVLDTAALDSRVPGCPDWSLRDLASHLGRVQRFWAEVVRAGADTQPAFPEEQTTPDGTFDLSSWMRESTTELLDALRPADPATPAWTWWRDDRTVGAIARHQVQEAAVHRWDAQSAAGTPAPLAAPVADDGVDEFLWIARQLREPAPITFVTTDSGVARSVADVPPAVTVTAPASDLVLLLYGRVGVDAVQVDGDGAVLTAFLQPIR
jgi:uncharacterized protein (TIGR03083 family)